MKLDHRRQAARNEAMKRSYWRNWLRPISLRSARRARRAPASWRLLAIALALGVAAQLWKYLLPLAAMAGLVGVWGLLSRRASTQHLTEVADPWSVRSGRTQRMVGYLNGLALLSAYLIFAVDPFSYFLREVEARETILILASISGALLLVFTMTAQGWRIGYSLLTGGVALVALAGGVAMSTRFHHAADIGWLRTFARLAMVFAAAESLTPAAAGAPPKLGLRGLIGFQYATLLMVFAIVVQEPGAVGPDEAILPWFWWSLVALCSAATLWFLWLARVPAAVDLRWLTRQRSTKPMPKGAAVAIAYAPALGLAAFSGWAVWTTVFCLGVFSSLLTLINGRLDRSGVVGASRRQPSAAVA
jgi:hypothetical protein